MTSIAASYPSGPIRWVPLSVLLLLTMLAGLALDRGRTASSGAELPAVEASYGDLPLHFMRDGGGYTASTDAGSVVLDDEGATIVPFDGRHAGEPVSIGLVGAASTTPQALAKLPGIVNDLRGEDRSAWRTGIPTFERVRYAGVYPGDRPRISTARPERSSTTSSSARSRSRADRSRVRRRAGASHAMLGRSSSATGADAIRQAPPVAFQPSADGRDPVQASFQVRGDRVGFELGAYDRARPLVIDPLVLSYSTFLGGADARRRRRHRGRLRRVRPT